MANVLVSVYSWETPRLFESNLELGKDDKVIVASEFGNELGVIAETDVESPDKPAEKILRSATPGDIEAYERNEKDRLEYLEICRQDVKALNLQMKMIDAKISLDSRQVIFVFTADGRIDFRELVKSLSSKIKKTVRMQQIGIRDEARKLGGYGICGREICCVNFSGNLQSITTDMARIQQIAHRGTERISGLCGRLMCCLAYEADQYKSMMIGLPEVYSVVKTAEGKGTVIEINAVMQEIKVKLESGKYVIFKKEDIL